MTIKVRDAMKGISLLSLLLLLVVSCSDDDLNSIDAGFIDNLNFVTKDTVFEVQFDNEFIDSVESELEGQFLLGVYDEEGVGKIRSSFVSQLMLPDTIEFYSETIHPDTIVTRHIDAVILTIPYHSSVRLVEEDGNIYQLDSVFGKSTTDTDDNVIYEGFNVKVHELATFLNPLDPNDPSAVNKYYSNRDYDVAALLRDEAAVTVSPLDTAAYFTKSLTGDIWRKSFSDRSPYMSMLLDPSYFETKLLNILPEKDGEVPAELKTQESFIRYMKGLYVEVTSTIGASTVTFPLTNASVDMHYSNVISLVSTGVNIDTIAALRRFDLGGVKANKHEPLEKASYPRDSDKLYIQGTAGSLSNVKLFDYDDQPGNETVVSDELRDLRTLANDDDNNMLWLINEANLLFYVDGEEKPSIDKLFLYKKVPSINGALPYNSQLLDYITASNLSVVDGDLTEDIDEDGQTSYYYKFKITDYMTDLLSGKNADGSENNRNVDNFGLKIYNPGDYPKSTIDSLVKTPNWNPRGVVLFGGTGDGDTNEKRVKLNINYSYQNR